MLLFVSFKTIQATKLGKNTYTQELSSEKLRHYHQFSLLFTYAPPFCQKQAYPFVFYSFLESCGLYLLTELVSVIR